MEKIQNLGQKLVASAAIGALIFGLVYAAGSGTNWLMVASALGIGMLFGTTFCKSKGKIELTA
jgi:membrane protease YdiL (CAAX protease family)